MSSKVIKRQRNRFDGTATQVNIASRGGVAGNGNSIRGGGDWPFFQSSSIVAGHEIDPRCKPYSRMNTNNGRPSIDGRFCVLKTIGGKQMWSLDGATEIDDGTALNDSDDDTESSSSSESSSSDSDSSSSSLSSGEKRRRKQYKRSKKR